MPGDLILAVDDNAVNLRLVAMLLRAHGYEVQTAGDAEEARALLETCHPRLILMDIQLPGTDGLTLARHLKADPAMRDVVIVAVTAYAMKGDEKRALDAGCDGYVAKPIDIHELPRLVARHIARGGVATSRREGLP